MPNYSVKFKDGRQMTVWATNQKGAEAKAKAKYKRRTGKKGRIAS